MKRILLMFIVAAFVTFASCGKNNSSPISDVTSAPIGTGISEKTHENSSFTPTGRPVETQSAITDFYAANLNSAFANHQYELACETDISIYYVRQFVDVGNFTRYMVFLTDKEYRDWIPLCGRPDCMHDNENCSAWLEGRVNYKIWLYGNHIYYALGDGEDPELWRMKLDGSDHEKILELSRPDPDTDGSWSWSWTFHNKYLIVDYKDMEVSGGLDTTTYVVDLSAHKLEQKKLDVVLDSGERSFVGKCVAGRDNIVYHWQNENVQVAADPVSGEIKTKTVTALYKTDLETGASRKLCVLPFQPFFGSCSLEGELLYFCGSTDENSIISVNTETGELTTVNTAELYTVRWFTPYNGYIFGSADGLSSKPDGTPLDDLGTNFYDLSGEPVCSIPYENYSADIYILFVLGDYVFGVEHTNTRDDPASLLPTWYLDLSKIGTEDFGWHRWEP